MKHDDIPSKGLVLCKAIMEGEPIPDEDERNDVDMDMYMEDDEMGDDDEVAQAEGDAAAPGDLDGAILDPFLDLFVEDEGGDLSPDGMEGGLAGPDALQPGVISQEQADIIFGEVEPLPEEEEIVEQIPYGPVTVQQEGLRFNEVLASTVEKLRRIWRLL